MEYPHDADATQVGHLFLKAASEGVIKSEEASAALRSLFPDLFEPTVRTEDDALAELVDELLAAADRGMDVRLSLRMKTALEALRFQRAGKAASG